MRAQVFAAILAMISGTSSAAVSAASHAVTMDDHSFLLDGKRTYIWSGEFHPYRLPSPDLWRDILQKMKAAGFNATSIYFSWSYHSPAEGVYDFTGVRDMDRLLDIAAEEGVYVIARPGPYINAEVDSGGFPLWLTRKKVQNRTTDPGYQSAADEWLSRIDAIIARHQWTDGRGSVIAYQVENEFYRGDTADGRAHITHLKQKAVADGITVPLVGNHNGNFVSGASELVVDGWDYYPQGFDCSNPGKWKPVPNMSDKRVPGEPLFTPEFQGGAFDPWGGPGYGKCAQLINDRFANIFYKQNIASGATAQNFYMLYGGTSWGWQAFPANYSSYDYGAAITEARQFDPKYAEDKLIGYFAQAAAPLLKTNGSRSASIDNDSILDVARTNPETGTQFHYLRHLDSTADTVETFRMNVSADRRSYRIPQAPGTGIALNGRQAKILLVDFPLGDATLAYSTSELMTQAAIGERDVAIFYGDHGQPGETLLRLTAKPAVKVLAGEVSQEWSETDGLRLNYRHGELARVLVTVAGRRPLLMLLGNRDEAIRFWRRDTVEGPVLMRGTHLLRSAAFNGNRLALTGDVGAEGKVEIFSTATQVSWNGANLAARATSSGSLAATVATARAITLPVLRWQAREEAPEIAPAFDDRDWMVADRTTTASITPPGSLPVLFADDYGFHTANWC